MAGRVLWDVLWLCRQDETILPTDYKSAGMIVDDELNALMVQPLQYGVMLHALIDACHSGTAMDLPYRAKYTDGRFSWKVGDAPCSTLQQAGGSALVAGICHLITSHHCMLTIPKVVWPCLGNSTTVINCCQPGKCLSKHGSMTALQAASTVYYRAGVHASSCMLPLSEAQRPS
jgi:hypothetical protein